MFDSCYCINSICLFVKIWETIWHFILLPFGRQRASAHFLNIRLSGPSASRSSRWLPSFDSTSMFRSDSTRWLLYNCSSANKIQIHQQKRRNVYAIISMQNEPNPFLCHPEVLEAEILEHVFFHNCFTLSATS